MRTWRLALAVGLSALALHAAGAGSLPLLDRDEPRFAEASREMRERGDWIVPHFNNEPRLAKPPLIYWSQAASYALFGETDFAARFPSALFAALTALLVFGFGRRLYGDRAGLWASIVFSTSLHVLALAKAASADMAMIFFFTASAWSGWELLRGEKKARLAFYLSLALGFLAKGPIAFLPLLAILFWTRRTGIAKPLGALGLWAGLPFIVCVVGLWAVPALVRTNGDYFTVGIGKNVLGRSLEAMEGHGGRGALTYLLMLPFYFVAVFPSFWPWSLYLPGLFTRLRDGAARAERENYLLTLILSVFAVFTLAATKLPHYTLPAFPMLSILLAGSYAASGRPLRPWAVLSAAAAACALAVSLWVFPLAARLSPSAELARQSAPWLRPEMEFASVEYNEPSLVWVFRKYVRGWHTALSADQVSAFMEKPGPRFCVLPTSLAEKLFGNDRAEWKSARTEGFNPAKGKRSDLTLIAKTA